MNIVLTTIILFVVFGVLLFMGVPISVSIIVSSIVTAMSTLSWDQITFITMQKMNSGIESFSLLAVPLFILAGNIMNNGGIAKRLVNFAQLFVGKLPGNLAQANILGNMLFGALSGSSVAAASAMGGCISPIEKEQEYDPAYSAAANIASAPTGLLIPPTSAFIVYSTVAGGVSISTLFMAGYVPGILMGLGCMVVAFIYAKKMGIKATGRDKSISVAKTIWDAIPSLLLIIIVIGGIRYLYCNGRCRYCSSLLPHPVHHLQEYRFQGIYGDSPELCKDFRNHPVPDFCFFRDVIRDGLFRNPGSNQQCAALGIHKQICHLHPDERHSDDHRYVHGHHSGNPDFYTDLPADCTELWHERHPVWRNVNFQYVPWKYHTAGRLRTFCRMWYRTCID